MAENNLPSIWHIHDNECVLQGLAKEPLWVGMRRLFEEGEIERPRSLLEALHLESFFVAFFANLIYRFRGKLRVWGQTMAAGLFDHHKSCLIVIDVQQYFLDKLPLDWRQPLVERIAWLMRVARMLDIPVIATAEDISKDGPLVPPVISELPPGAVVHDKMVFGLCGQTSILDDVKNSGRGEFVVVGLETDVCVAHSAIGLQDEGFRVAVIEDATASPPPHHDHGIRRIAAAGVAVTSVKGIYYEWVRDLATAESVQQRMNTYLPPGLTL